MIADWTVDAELESPRITVPWDGWVDLRPGMRSGTADTVALARGLAEVQAFPGLEELLASANTARMFTVKVDVFPVSREEVDPEIWEGSQQVDASGFLLEHTLVGFGSYLDVVLAPELIPATLPSEAFSYFEEVARSAARTLEAAEHRLACAEIVVRPAQLYDRDTFGWTLYAIGFGADEAAAKAAWAPAARSLVAALEQAIADTAGSTGE